MVDYPTKDRNLTIYVMHNMLGCRYRDIAEYFGISVERVRQIVCAQERKNKPQTRRMPPQYVKFFNKRCAIIKRMENAIAKGWFTPDG